MRVPISAFENECRFPIKTRVSYTQIVGASACRAVAWRRLILASLVLKLDAKRPTNAS